MPPDVLQKKGVPLSDRFELVSYTEMADSPISGAGERRCTLYDKKEKREIELFDRGRDGNLDAVLINQNPQSPDPTFQKLYQDAVQAAQSRIPSYLKDFEEALKPGRIETVGIDGYSEGRQRQWRIHNGKRDFYFDCLRQAEGVFECGDVKVREGMVLLAPLKITDQETGLRLSLNSPETVRLKTDAAGSLDPLLQLAKIESPTEDVEVHASGRWLPFLKSASLASLYGHENGGQPSDVDKAIAGLLLKTFATPEEALSILSRYDGERTPEAFQTFLNQENQCAERLSDKFQRAVPFIRTQVIPHASIDLMGRLSFRDSFNPTEPLLKRLDDPFTALDSLVKKYSYGRLRLREKTLDYLDRCLSVPTDKGFLFEDPEQNHGNPLFIPPAELMSLVFGGLDRHKPGISVDGFYLHDENGDGRINASGDVVEKKTVEDGYRQLKSATIDQLLAELATKYPPPFDPHDFETVGVPLAKLREWAETVHNDFVIKKHWSKNPLEDGKYKVFIYRGGDLGPENPLLWLFAKINGFDDVFVVPPVWGMEIALNEVASRNIPVDELYIGSHGDQFMIGDIPLDYDRHLTFAKGAKIVFTGCKTTEGIALLLGAQLFKDSEGSLIWADALNAPTPFGGLLSTGTIYKTTFDRDHRSKTAVYSTHLVDPIPGGLF